MVGMGFLGEEIIIIKSKEKKKDSGRGNKAIYITYITLCADQPYLN